MASTAMVPSWKKSLPLTVLLCSCTSYADSVSLSDFQSISSFSTACTAVWKDSIPDCSTKDFKKGHSCSSKCIAGLETISILLNKACEGQRAEKDTLIGLFLQGEGVSTLCPNFSSSSSTQSTTESQTVDTSSTSTSTSTETTTKTKTSQSEVTTTTEQQSSTQTSTSQLPQSTSATTTSSTTAPESTSALTTTPSTLSTSLSSTTATAITTANVEPSSPTSSVSSSSSSSSSTNSIPPEATRGFGGSGNAFDILAGAGSRAERRSRQMAGVALAVAWVAGNGWQ